MDIDYSAYFRGYIEKHAFRYYPEAVSMQIKVSDVARNDRSRATLYRYRMEYAGVVRFVIIKMPGLKKQNSKSHKYPLEKPSLFPKADAVDLPKLQFNALNTISNHFLNIKDQRLGAIRVLDYISEYQAVLMEESQDPDLRQLFLAQNRLLALMQKRNLVPAFYNAGLWLSSYHKMLKEDAVVRHSSRGDFIDGVRLLTEFLSRLTGDTLFFARSAAFLEDGARLMLPDVLPLVLGHGDYALRNLLVGGHDQITSIDTLSKWRVPLYEDLGYFLNSYKMISVQVASQGLAFGAKQLKVYETSFLNGYFGGQNPIPFFEVKLFEALALLDKWASVLVATLNNGQGFENRGVSLRASWLNRYFKSRLNVLQNELAFKS